MVKKLIYYIDYLYLNEYKIKMMKKILLISFTLIVFSNFINAQIVTDRPDVTESSSVIPKNSFQIESGMICQKSGEANFNPIIISAPSTLFRYAPSKYFEIRLISQYQNYISFNPSDFPNIASGFNDIELGTKIQLFRNETSNTEIAFLTHLSVPTGTSGLSNDYASINKIAVSHGVTDYLGIGYNLGYRYDFNGLSTLLYSLSIGYSINDKFGFYVEPYGDITEFNDHLININGGLVIKVKDNLQADFAFGTGINHIMNFYAIGFGWNIARNKE